MSKFNLSHFKKLCANKTTLKQRILEATEYAGKYLYWFEEGTTRNVFRLNKTSVLKIAKPDYDVSENILQNKIIKDNHVKGSILFRFICDQLIQNSYIL